MGGIINHHVNNVIVELEKQVSFNNWIHDTIINFNTSEFIKRKCKIHSFRYLYTVHFDDDDENHSYFRIVDTPNGQLSDLFLKCLNTMTKCDTIKIKDSMFYLIPINLSLDKMNEIITNTIDSDVGLIHLMYPKVIQYGTCNELYPWANYYTKIYNFTHYMQCIKYKIKKLTLELHHHYQDKIYKHVPIVALDELILGYLLD